MTGRSPAGLLVHIVWNTRWRRRVLEERFDEELFQLLGRQASALGCSLIAAGCGPEHVHAVVRLAPSVALADLVRRMKGGSGYDAAHRHPSLPPLTWQRRYHATSISPYALPRVVAYVRSQRQRHGEAPAKPPPPPKPSPPR